MKKVLLAIFTAGGLVSALHAQDYLDDVMLQSFGWDEYKQPRNTAEGGLYEFYASRAGNLKAVGFDMIWMPPPSKSTGGVGYFPTELYNFSLTSWGTELQLKKMLNNMNQRGINPIADVVANHRSGTSSWTDFTNPTWGCETIVSNDEAATDPNNTGCRPSGAADTGEGFVGSRDMDHTNATVQTGYKEYLSRLKALGFKGWRWDVAKGFAPQYFGMYIKDSQPYYSVGEYWDGNVDNVKNWINATYSGGATISGAFDFPLYYALSQTIVTSKELNSNGQPVQIATNQYANINWGGAMAGLAGQFGFADKAVTFVDNHDTFVHSSAFTGAQIPMAYAYILTHPGIPSVFAPHYFGGTYTKDNVTRTYSTSNKSIIEKLIAIRKNAGIDAYSHVQIDAAKAGLYAAYIKKRSSDAEAAIAMRMGVVDWTPAGSGWIKVLSAADDSYTVWARSAVNVAPSITINEPSGSFTAGTPKSVTITATDDSNTAPVIRYTLDGSDPTASSAIYTGPISVSQTSTVKAVAFDNQNLSSGVAERNYTFTTGGGLTVHFKSPVSPPNSVTWSSPKIYYWNVLPAGTLPDASWDTPISMTAEPSNPGWYSYTFVGATQANIIFRSGDPTGTVGKTQTGNIENVTKESWYQWDETSANFVKDVTAQLGTANSEVKAQSLTLLENPTADGLIRVKYSQAKGGTLYLYDLTGKLVKSFRTVADSTSLQELNISGIKSGLYVLELKSSATHQTVKVMVK